MTAESLCMGCMESKYEGRCPNPLSCGWIEGTPQQSPLQLPARTILEQRYVLGRVLGQGGFGITYLAADLRNLAKLALKEYFPNSFATRDTDRRTVTCSSPRTRAPFEYGLAKFEDEGRTLLGFRNHTNIVSVVDFFKANATGYIVMEYLEGATLQEYLKQQPEGRIAFDQALRILIPIMDALREVHRAGFTHRDVSPDNIYMCQSGPIKLLDFGAARHAFRDQTQSQQLILKPGYTPEEQYRRTGVPGPWTDIYSLAATMYRSVTGQVPPEATERLIQDEMRFPTRLGAKIPPRAEKALMRALAVRAQDRYQTMEGFQKDITVEPPPPPPPPPPVPPPWVVPTRASLSNRFYALWSIGAVAMFAGSYLSSRGVIWLFLAGLVPAGLSLVGAIQLRLRAASQPVGASVVLFLLLTAVSILVTAIHPLGIVLLTANLFMGGATIGRLRDSFDLPPPPDPPKARLQCVAGEHEGSTLEVGVEPIVIGRNATTSNLVFSSVQISGSHARVWLEAADRRLWVEDLASLNGTYVMRCGGDGLEGPATRLKGRDTLTSGDQFWLSRKEIAAFRVEGI